MIRRVLVTLGMTLCLLLAQALPHRYAVLAAGKSRSKCHYVTKKVHGKKTKVKVCTAAKPKNISAAKVADTLATAIYSASSDNARYAALVTVMKTLQIPVITADGTIVSSGKVTDLSHDLYFYDFELRAIAGALGRGTATDLSHYSWVLALTGIQEGDGPVDADLLRQALEGGIHQAQGETTDPTSIIPLLVRALGLHHQQPYDLGAGAPLASIQLDALQSFLITAEFLYPLVQSGAVTLRPSMRVHAVSMRPTAAEPCSGITGKLAGTARPLAKTLFMDWLGKVAQGVSIGVKKTLAVLDAIHATLLAYSIAVHPLDTGLLSTHYGPAGHASNAGNPLRFRVKVENQDNYGETAVNCGSLAGYSVPAQGGMKDIPIIWNQAVDDLNKYGTITYEPASGQTDGNGVATLVFTPKTEKIPGFGIEKDARGSLDAIGLYRGTDPTKFPVTWDAFKNTLKSIDPGLVGQYLFPKFAGFAWEVTYHKPRGFKFSGLTWSVHDNFGVGYPESTSTYTVSGSVCGDDPNALWTLQVHEVSNWPVFGAYKFDGVLTFPWTPGLTMPMGKSRLANEKTTTTFTTGQNPTLTVRITTSGPQAGPPDQTVTVPVQEDLSCPDNSAGG